MMQFITLTGRGYFTPTSSIHFFRKNWPKMRKRIEHVTAKWADVTETAFNYFLVPERHKSGVLHAHALVTTYEGRKRWYKDTAHKCGFGWMADCQPIDTPGEAVGYITKYLHKDAGGMDWPKNFMRVRHSKGWPMADDKKNELYEWHVIRENEIPLEKGALLDQGYYVIDRTIDN